ncbi:site-specific integrase [Enterococcus sp. ALS3]|uniref:Site-specific integrase n=1 Tax=Enterococcus alishanensis TaxID=1303817 RepID=A0ABS6TH89_9ENTE|nr:site-specific integrase [Enterococcus alishanensis]MBV7392279.1 site-specific integrase [Enterococcus alishanensis]
MTAKGNNIYLRKDGRWEGRYQINRKLNGQIKYGYIYGKSFEEVAEKLVPLRKKTEKMRQLYGESTVTYQEWIDYTGHEIFEGLKPSTVASYRYKIKRYLLPFMGKTSLYEITESFLKEITVKWQEMGLSNSTCTVILRILNKTLRHAVAKKIVSEDLVQEMPKIKIQPQKVHALSQKEEHALKNAVENYDDDKGKAVIFALDAGLRIGEIAGLRWEDIDFEQNIITVNHTYQRIANNQGQGTEMSLGSAKTTASHRIIPMLSEVRELLEKMKKTTNSPYILSVRGKACEPRLLTYHFHCIRKMAGLENIHFHQLRHTFATRCLESSSDISSISAMMGHASTQMTLDIYTDSLLEQRRAVIQGLEYKSA